MSTFKRLTPEQMDTYLISAEKSLDESVSKESVEAVSTWWNKWFMIAGHRRLGRLLRDKTRKTSRNNPQTTQATKQEIPTRNLRAYTSDTGFQYVIKASELIDATSMFSVETVGSKVIIDLNITHPMYPLLEASVASESNPNPEENLPSLRNEAVRILLEAWARFEEEQPEGRLRETAKEIRQSWGRAALSSFVTSSNNDE